MLAPQQKEAAPFETASFLSKFNSRYYLLANYNLVCKVSNSNKVHPCFNVGYVQC